jgi:uncharacterized damage-inducible protein DinB
MSALFEEVSVRSPLLIAVVLLTAPLAHAQAPDPNPYTTAIRQQHRRIDGIVTRAAEKVPEDLYGFKPTPEVRSFAEIVGHIVDAHHLLCRAAHENVFEIKRDFELKPGTKADLLAALKKSIAYCEQAFDGTTDANGTTPVKAGGSAPMQKLMVLNLNVSHSWEHYGNLVTYMRLKGIVPPTSEPTK